MMEMAEKIPSRPECLEMLRDNGVPDNIIAHSVAVADISMEYGRKIKENGGEHPGECHVVIAPARD